MIDLNAPVVTSRSASSLMRLATDTSKFGRWGDDYAYHIDQSEADDRAPLEGHRDASRPQGRRDLYTGRNKWRHGSHDTSNLQSTG
jgi:hypothetical protein